MNSYLEYGEQVSIILEHVCSFFACTLRMGGMKLRFQSYQTCFLAKLFRVEAVLIYFDETNYRRFEHAVVLESIIGRVGGSMDMLIMGGGGFAVQFGHCGSCFHCLTLLNPVFLPSRKATNCTYSLRMYNGGSC